MFKKILIADRGEIALRIIRACKELGISTVAVHSEADANSLHVRYAEEDVCVGPAPGRDSYQNVANILGATELCDVDAIHPGYGPLAENAEFAEVCASCDLTFIGPSADSIRRMGDKALARSTMKEAGAPVIPGSDGAIQSLDEALEWADKVGYPLRLKASAGGGGRGMRVVQSRGEMEEAWRIGRVEARHAFADDSVYLERSIENACHIEIQVLGDHYGNVVHLGERECSIQRRHQKLVEESPSPVVDAALRERLGEAALRGVGHLGGYSGVGTVEFLVDENMDFYFLEMNTRIQVEHPVTEMVTGLDLIKEQIRVATGDPLGYSQDDITLTGHALECRINAEDPDKNFIPSAGRITALQLPGGPGVRVDSHIYQGYDMPPYYDPLLAKVISYGRDRNDAITKMRRILDEFTIEGVATTLPFHRRLMSDAGFIAGQFDTEYVANKL